MRELLTLLICLIGLFLVYAILVRLLQAFVSFVDETVDVVVALVFFLVIVPPLWIWERGRRPMWRNLTSQQ